MQLVNWCRNLIPSLVYCGQLSVRWTTTLIDLFPPRRVHTSVSLLTTRYTAFRWRWWTGSARTLLQIYLVPAQSKLLTIKAGAGIGHTIGGPVWTCARLRAPWYVRTRGSLPDPLLYPPQSHIIKNVPWFKQLMKWAGRGFTISNQNLTKI